MFERPDMNVRHRQAFVKRSRSFEARILLTLDDGQHVGPVAALEDLAVGLVLAVGAVREAVAAVHRAEHLAVVAREVLL